jgi:hypothetical protein
MSKITLFVCMYDSLRPRQRSCPGDGKADQARKVTARSVSLPCPVG